MKWDTAVTTVLALCALATTGLLVRHEFFLPHSQAQAETKPAFVEHWRQYLARGERMGAAEAPVQLIEFGDFECPYCARLYKSVRDVRARYPSKVTLTYVHYPLPMHRFAEPAARAAECAGLQGRFEAMHDQLFEQQDRLGLTSWHDMAKEAGVRNLAGFDSCMKSEAPVPAVTQGRQLGKDLNVTATPTLIVNGWRLAGLPTDEELDVMVKAILKGESPYSKT